MLLELAEIGRGVDDGKFESGDLGEILDHLSGDGLAEAGVVRAPGVNPRRRPNLEVRFGNPERAGHRQADRAQAVYLLQELVQQVPDGVYLKSIKQTGLKINMTGYSQSNARVSTLMRNFSGSPYLENPELVEIKSATVSNKRVSEFNMNVSLKRLGGEDASKAGKAAPKAPGAKG